MQLAKEAVDRPSLATSRITTIKLGAIRFLDRILVRVLVGKSNETQDNDFPLSNGDLRFR